jgi:hypothetical protein
MNRYFSPSTGAFYVEAIHGVRQIAEPLTEAQVKAKRKPRMIDNPGTLIPADAVPVSHADHAALLAAQAEGKAIIARGGRPVAVDPAPPAPAQQLEVIRAKRNRLLAQTDMMAAVPDYPITADQRAELIIWRAALRDMMAAIDPADPFGSVQWPVAPAWLAAHGVMA